jgi:predicted dinucleotide-utilizing enzyme
LKDGSAVVVVVVVKGSRMVDIVVVRARREDEAREKESGKKEREKYQLCEWVVDNVVIVVVSARKQARDPLIAPHV